MEVYLPDIFILYDPFRFFWSNDDCFNRFKNCFFRSQEALKKSEKKLLQLLKTEVAAGPISRQNSMEMVELPVNSDGLDVAFEVIKQIARKNYDVILKETEEDVLKNYLA